MILGERPLYPGQVHPRLVLAILAAAASFAVGCGADEVETPVAATPTPIAEPDISEKLGLNIVDNRAIDERKAGTPERGLLEWWQAMQFGDATGVDELTAAATVTALSDRVISQVADRAGPGLGRPEIIRTTVTGANARLRVAMLRYKNNRLDPDGTQRFTLRLSRDGDRWKFADTRFLRNLARGYGIRV